MRARGQLGCVNYVRQIGIARTAVIAFAGYHPATHQFATRIEAPFTEWILDDGKDPGLKAPNGAVWAVETDASAAYRSHRFAQIGQALGLRREVDSGLGLGTLSSSPLLRRMM